VQLLWATSYGTSDIYNGGFHQFFSNWTGIVAPEMTEWCMRAGFEKTADIIREAIGVFGADFPRSQTARRDFLDAFPARNRGGRDRSHETERKDWDPFYEMDDRFYVSLRWGLDRHAFDDAADRWLREICGIHSLHDTLQNSTPT
jgi:hypothetical protein